MQRYIIQSIELHLFFARIMKEHSLFLEAGFPTKDKNFIEESEMYKNEFEKLLLDVVNVSNGLVSPEILNASELVTEYTHEAEVKTENLSGISINKTITELEKNFQPRTNYSPVSLNSSDIQIFNKRALDLVNGLINFKERILNDVLTCNIFTVNYPLLIEHILREAKLYRSYIIELETNHNIASKNLKQTELFWNQIMMEHALFIRGLLDPAETDLVNTANNFAWDYKNLIDSAKIATDMTIQQSINTTIQETLKYRDFKSAGTKGLLECNIRAIVLPLLADHVLREANHYLRILNENLTGQ